MTLAGSIIDGISIADKAMRIIRLGDNGYPTEGIKYALNTIKSKYWKYNLGYEFEVEEGSGLLSFATGGELKKFAKFRFQINPQSIIQSENPSISVIPCQTGVVVEHQGFVMKTLVIAGTTGLRPKGEVRTGYKEFMLLRNYLRAYSEIKKDPLYKNFRLIFNNRQDNEKWYVEPVGPGLVMKREANLPYMYHYTISLLIIGKAGLAKTGIGVVDNVLNEIEKWEDIIDSVSDKIEDAAALIHDSVDVLRYVWTDVTSTILQPLDNARKVIQAMNYGKNTLSALPKQFYKDLRRSLAEVRDSCYDLVGKGSSNYNKTFGRTGLEELDVKTMNIYKAIEGANLGVAAMDKILSTDVLFSAESGMGIVGGVSDRLDDAIMINSTDVQSRRLSSNQALGRFSKDGLGYIPPSSVREATVEYQDTLERMAYRELGDATMWYQIVLLNNLDAPYISEEPIPGKRTVVYGGKIMIPVYGASDNAGRSSRDITTHLTQDMTIFERNLGTDLKLDGNGDIIFDPYVGDVRLIAGMQNMAQAVKINLALEKGSLMYHPQKGVYSHVGDKNDITAMDILDSIEESILSDKRVQAINEIGVERDSVGTYINLVVKPKQLYNPVPLQIELEGRPQE